MPNSIFTSITLLRNLLKALSQTLRLRLKVLIYPFRMFVRRNRMELCALGHPGRFLTQPELIHRLNKLRNGRTRFHIICGGYSAPSTVKQIGADDFVLGFGYAGLIDVPFDAYFYEVASFGNSWDSLLTRVFARFYDQNLRHRTKELFIKNYWNGRVDCECLEANFTPVPCIVMDVHVPAWPPYQPQDLRRQVCASLLDSKSRCLSQAGGSAITMLCLAIKAGANEIILHGLDLSGPHFYATRSWPIPESLLDAGFRGIYPIKEGNEYSHATKRATEILIPLIKQISPEVEIHVAKKA